MSKPIAFLASAAIAIALAGPASGQGSATHGTGFVALAGAPRRVLLKTSVLICAFDENVREFLPQLFVMPALNACEPVI